MQVFYVHKKCKSTYRTSKAFIRFTDDDDDDNDDDDDFRAYPGISGFRERDDEQRLRNASHADVLPLDPFRLN